MKRRKLILLAVGIVPVITGWLCNALFMYATGISSFLMMCSPWVWLAVCIAAADRRGKVFSQSLLLFAVGIVMIAVYICYRAFLIDAVSIFSPLNSLPQYYLGNWTFIAARIYGLFDPKVISTGPIYYISAVLSCVFTFAGVFIKTRFKNVERDF